MTEPIHNNHHSPKLRKKILTLTDCTLCRQSFTDPRMLPCMHTFCLTCLEKASNEARCGDKMPCPLCSKTFVVPAASVGGLAALRNSYFLEKLIEINKISVGAVKPCQLCVDRNKLDWAKSDAISIHSNSGVNSKPNSPTRRSSIAPAKLYCVDCEQNVCNDCASTHSIHCKGHRIVPIESLSPMKNGSEDPLAGMRFRPNFCSEHKSEQLRWHCSTCSETVCTLCRDLRHRNHACDDVIEVHEEFRKQLQQDIDKVTELLPERLQARHKVDHNIDKFSERVRQLTSEISTAGEQLKRQIDQMTKSLSDQLVVVQRERIRELEQVAGDIDRDVSIVDGFRQYARAVKDKGTPCDVSRAVHDLNTRALELAAQKFVSYDDVLDSFGVEFQSVVPQEQDQRTVDAENLLGRIVITDQGIMTTSNTLQHGTLGSARNVKATLVTRLDTDKRYVIGLGQLLDRLYVICGCSNTIRVYDVTQGYKRLDVIKLSKLKDPADLSVSEASSCLYVTDSGNSCVWKVGKLDKNGLGGKVDRWLNGVGWPYKTSVTSDGRVLIISWSPSIINIYSPDATRIRTVQLHAELVEPQNAVETSSGNFIVTHGWTNNQVHQVVEIGPEGQFLRTFGESRGSGPKQLDLPCHIALDPLGRIFVADYNNSRVILVDTPFKSSRRGHVLVSWSEESVKEPRRIAFIPSAGGATATTLPHSNSRRLSGILSSPFKSGDKHGKGKSVDQNVVPEEGSEREFGRLFVGLGGAVDIFSLSD